MKKTLLQTLFVLSFCAGLFSFSMPGGEGYEIYFSSRLVAQQFGKPEPAKMISLNQGKPGDQLVVKYFHCGQKGTDRYLSISNAQGRMLKRFHFPDVKYPVSAMSFQLSELVSLRASNGPLKLYYSAHELPEGRCIAEFE